MAMDKAMQMLNFYRIASAKDMEAHLQSEVQAIAVDPKKAELVIAHFVQAYTLTLLKYDVQPGNPIHQTFIGRGPPGEIFKTAMMVVAKVQGADVEVLESKYQEQKKSAETEWLKNHYSTHDQSKK